MVETQADFLMEVTDKTKADIKGGTLIDYEGQIRLLEIAQVPSEHVEDFKASEYCSSTKIRFWSDRCYSPQIQNFQHQQPVDQPERYEL